MTGPLLDARATRAAIFDHLDLCFREHKKELLRPSSPAVVAALPELRVARIEPSSRVEPWVYVSVGAWQLSVDQAQAPAAEYMILAAERDDELVAWVGRAVLRHQAAGRPLPVGDVVPLGQPWRPHSDCDRLLCTLPYPYGPALEEVPVSGLRLRIRWLVPIDAPEERLLQAEGLEALEARLEAARADFTDPLRDSVG